MANLIRIHKPKHVNKMQIATRLEVDGAQHKQLEQQNEITNIFTLQPSANQFKQEKGPRYDSNGELIKYSLVGKSEWYNKQQFQGKKTYFDESTTKHAGTRQMGGDDKTTYRPTFDTKSIQRKTNGSEKKQLNKMKEQIRTKNQLLDEIDSIKSRMACNRRKDKDNLDTELPDFVKNHFIKQQALFEKHQENQEGWDQFVISTSTKLERDPFYSQLLRSEQYRSKLEAAQTFEVLKSDSERYGTRVWYNTLRAQEGPTVGKKFMDLNDKDKDILIENSSQIPLIMNQDLPDAFKHTFLSGLKGTIEYIRKPQNLSTFNSNQMNVTISSKSRVSTMQQNSQVPFQSFQSDKYLRDRMNVFAKNFSQQNIISYDRLNELDQLMIQGRSQFEAESELVLKDKRDGMAIYKKYVTKPDEVPTREPDEIIAMNYSSKMKLPVIRGKGGARGGRLRKQDTMGSSQSHISGMNISGSDRD